MIWHRNFDNVTLDIGGLINGEATKFIFRLGAVDSEWQLVQRLQTARAYHALVVSPLDFNQVAVLGGACTKKLVECDDTEVIKLTRDWDGVHRKGS